MALAICLGAFMVGSVATAKTCPAGKHKVAKLFCCKDKAKSGDKSKPADNKGGDKGKSKP